MCSLSFCLLWFDLLHLALSLHRNTSFLYASFCVDECVCQYVYAAYVDEFAVHAVQYMESNEPGQLVPVVISKNSQSLNMGSSPFHVFY